jgi:DNA-binding beta-propeller fold protein YncE
MGLLCLLILGGISNPAYTAPQTPSQEPTSEEGNIAPIRVIGDRYPMFAGVAVDPVNDKVVMTDDNHFSVLLYDRDVPGDSEEITEYRRRIQGPQTRLSSVCGVALDPETQEMYVLNTDFGNNMLVFSYEQSGNASPIRELSVDHGGWGIFLDRKVNNELFFTIQHLNKIAVYRPNAQGNETTVRFIQGPKTRLVDPHGIFVDTENDEIVVPLYASINRAVSVGFRHRVFANRPRRCGAVAHDSGTQNKVESAPGSGCGRQEGRHCGGQRSDPFYLGLPSDCPGQRGTSICH